VGRVADALPIKGTKASRIRRLQRWLTNDRRKVDTISGPVVQQTLPQWHHSALPRVLERTEWGVVNVVMVGVAVLGRVIPLTWTLLPHVGSATRDNVGGWMPRSGAPGVIFV
jgi:hypothetical protein